MLGRDPGSGVADCDDHAIALDDSTELHATAAWRVAQRVRRQILQRLLQPHRIAGDDLRA